MCEAVSTLVYSGRKSEAPERVRRTATLVQPLRSDLVDEESANLERGERAAALP